ncbi:hypothetical protein [Psychrobacter sp. DAB_AL62B]|uniref:hypothetical protein n=1 Tax=Psychrobacter sp. DAB_AL62B TaxID=1028420 RepID=UPI0023812A65|nr:hypothetical protein [Psychrobacter sp. DAB_AL62B]MDE4454824.1 hypothetical protein [Psychrobacter sp. DAB_AL62B]
MKLINYNELLAKFKPSGYVSEDANSIANTLICELYIQPGNGLARFLSVDSCFDNHMAIRIWVQKRLDANNGYMFDEMCHQLESELYSLLPQIGYGY